MNGPSGDFGDQFVDPPDERRSVGGAAGTDAPADCVLTSMKQIKSRCRAMTSISPYGQRQLVDGLSVAVEGPAKTADVAIVKDAAAE
jgi:hypothetical protein